MVTKGRVELIYANIIRESHDGGVRVKVLEEGDSFNEYSFFSNETYDFTIRAIDYATIYKLQREDF